MRELKQCPFCGGEVELVKQKSDEFEFVLVWCKNCDATIGIGGSDNDQKVTEAWNTRATPWHTGTPTEEGWYLIQYLNSGEYDVGRWDGSDFVIEENLPMVLTSHRSVAWQKIEPFKEENNG